VGYVDFAWASLRVVVECDGYEFHAEREPFQRDRRRWSAFTRAGWRGAVITWFDVTRDPAYVVNLVTDLLAAAATDITAAANRELSRAS
jgi:very-short-patch-repair endonuclease